MYVKVYEFHIQEEKMDEYFRIQEKACKIYKNYLDTETTYLQSHDDPTKWMEMTTYSSEEDYHKNIAIINDNVEIQALFREFQALLLPENKLIKETDFTKVMGYEKNSF
ncbi:MULTISPECIES: hypothetical protein [unclassified Bacillus (in: firmicutes)]|uniref:hypothetical protein n=1 Tax=unclassified Bacillus (in: firmicutes) TaxID=185979 RepID=UPI0004E2541E|nr:MULTISPECIES: hypothetical protein [unclassified Bacillus (in: firmicutes)]CAI9388986.1 hypothetical protein BACSP_02339 [Bacillus sp. T2.9-1]